MSTTEFPSRLGKVVPSALAAQGIHTLEQTAQYTEKELLAMHGIGQKGISILKEELAAKNMRLKEPTVKPRIYTIRFASVYPLYIDKATKKGRTKAEVDEILCWLTGYSQEELRVQLHKQTDLETFLTKAPRLNPSRTLITGLICGIRVEHIEDPTTREIRYMDKLIDELANGKSMEKILRK